jgi:hypothetical protein
LLLNTNLTFLANGSDFVCCAFADLLTADQKIQAPAPGTSSTVTFSCRVAAAVTIDGNTLTSATTKGLCHANVRMLSCLAEFILCLIHKHAAFSMPRVGVAWAMTNLLS